MSKANTSPAAVASSRPPLAGQRELLVVGMTTPAGQAALALARALALTHQEGHLLSTLPGLPHAIVRQLLVQSGVRLQDGERLAAALQGRWDAIPRPGQVTCVELLDGTFQAAGAIAARQPIGRYQALVALVEDSGATPEPAAMIYNVARGVGTGPNLLRLAGVELEALWMAETAVQE